MKTNVITLRCENGKLATYIPEYSIVGYENESENIDILVKNVNSTMEAKTLMDKAFYLLANNAIEFTSKYHQFHGTKEEILSI